MSIPADRSRIKLPVKLTDGQWEFAFGGIVPAKDGAHAELNIDREYISDPEFLRTVEQRAIHKILPQGTALLVSVFTKPETRPAPDIEQHLLPFTDVRRRIAETFRDGWMSSAPSFVKVTLGRPTARQYQLEDNTGGLWLTTKGFEAVGLTSSNIDLPENIAKGHATSLNHALTLLSEAYEGWRISHTGNIYTRVLYQERDEKFYPLEVLRNLALATQQDSIAKDLWDKLMQKMTSRPSSQPR